MLDLKNGQKIEIIKNKVRLTSDSPPVVIELDISNTGRVAMSANGIPIASASNLEELVNKMMDISKQVQDQGGGGVFSSMKSFFGL